MRCRNVCLEFSPLGGFLVTCCPQWQYNTIAAHFQRGQHIRASPKLAWAVFPLFFFFFLSLLHSFMLWSLFLYICSLGIIYSFSGSLRYKVRLFIWDLFSTNVDIYCYKLLRLLLLHFAVFPFGGVSFFLDTLIKENIVQFPHISVFPSLLIITNFIPLCSEKTLNIISVLNLSRPVL